MTVEEVFQKVSGHMLKGIMFHTDMAEYFQFLGLSGYSKSHEDHAKEETESWRNLRRYYLAHYNRLLKDEGVVKDNTIPDSWFNYNRQEVDTNTLRLAVEDGFSMWIQWEKKTKSLYEQMSSELFGLGAYAAGVQLMNRVTDVDHELASAEQAKLNLDSSKYDIVYILDQQGAVT